MPPGLAEAIGPVLAIFGVGSMILIGMKIRYTHLRQTRLGQGGQEEMEHLTEDVATLHDEVRLLRQDFAEMYERVEFAERLLTRGQAEAADRAPGEPQ
ncbi:MAG: hypothetical protein OEO20_13285 [Gemmatimonadota bacterium]|nr:hypothetical protein [Gemmatimonadota bacterium]MDH3479266.1 hypothetical protein [Gemmatimonadota bacterium]MDH3570291.1 hypothetical protein [Gemmatimonadota bacterium]MDH5549752.1 hypothetical protein [Gemmatimonadota bacterium]